MSLRGRDRAAGSDFSTGAAGWECFSKRFIGLGISSKEEESSSEEVDSLSSVNLEARSLMDAVCWFMEGGGLRRADAAGGVGSASDLGAFLVGEGNLGDGARAVSL